LAGTGQYERSAARPQHAADFGGGYVQRAVLREGVRSHGIETAGRKGQIAIGRRENRDAPAVQAGFEQSPPSRQSALFRRGQRDGVQFRGTGDLERQTAVVVAEHQHVARRFAHRFAHGGDDRRQVLGAFLRGRNRWLRRNGCGGDGRACRCKTVDRAFQRAHVQPTVRNGQSPRQSFEAPRPTTLAACRVDGFQHSVAGRQQRPADDDQRVRCLQHRPPDAAALQAALEFLPLRVLAARCRGELADKIEELGAPQCGQIRRAEQVKEVVRGDQPPSTDGEEPLSASQIGDVKLAAFVRPVDDHVRQRRGVGRSGAVQLETPLAVPAVEDGRSGSSGRHDQQILGCRQVSLRGNTDVLAPDFRPVVDAHGAQVGALRRKDAGGHISRIVPNGDSAANRPAGNHPLVARQSLWTARGAVGPDQPTRCGFQSVQAPVVRRHEHSVAVHRRRDPHGAARDEAPEFRPARRIQAAERVVGRRAIEQTPVRDGHIKGMVEVASV
jgi:hypothetical protein